jgi:hypothetical protein
MKSFRPTMDATTNIDVGASSARVKVTSGDGEVCVRIMNNGSATAWITAGDVSVTADTTNDIPIPSGGVEVMTLKAPDGSALYIAAIAAGATGKIYFTPGWGI